MLWYCQVIVYFYLFKKTPICTSHCTAWMMSAKPIRITQWMRLLGRFALFISLRSCKVSTEATWGLQEKDRWMSDSRAQLYCFPFYCLSRLFHVTFHNNLVWSSWKLAAVVYFLQLSYSQTGWRWKCSQGFSERDLRLIQWYSGDDSKN